MRKRRIQSLTLAMILALSVTGCGGSEHEEETKAAQQGQMIQDLTSAKKETETSEKSPAEIETKSHRTSYDDSMIEDLTVEGEVKEDDKVVFEYSYTLPQFRDDKADQVNAELQDFMNTLERTSESMLFQTADYESFWNGSSVAIVIKMYLPSQQIHEYSTLTYDVEKGRLLTDEEILAMVDTTVEELEPALRREIARTFDAKQKDMGAQYGECLDGLMDLRAQTVSFLNAKPENNMFYLDEEKNIIAIPAVMTPAGTGYEYLPMQVELSDHGLTETLTNDFVTAEIRDNQVNLIFQETDLSKDFLRSDEIHYGEPYPVTGLYGNYKEAALTFLRDSGIPYLFLLDENGQVTAVNISLGLDYPTGFFALGPIPAPANFTKLETPDNGLTEGIAADGSRTSLIDLTLNAQMTMHPMLKGSEWSSDDGSFKISMGKEEAVAMMTDADGNTMDGMLEYMGLDQDGVHYLGSFFNEEGPVTIHLILQCDSTIFMAEGDNVMTITQERGNQISGLPTALKKVWE